MARKKKHKRPRVIKTLGDLLNGDTVVIETKFGELEVRRSFSIGNDVFLRIRDSSAKTFEKFPPNYPVKRVIDLTPTVQTVEAHETDPLLGEV